MLLQLGHFNYEIPEQHCWHYCPQKAFTINQAELRQLGGPNKQKPKPNYRTVWAR